MAYAHNAQSRPEVIDTQGEVGYLEDPRREFLRAIERVAQEVVESFRDDVFLPLVETLDPPSPWEHRVLWDPINPRPVPPPDPRIMDVPEVQSLVQAWKERWSLHCWDGRLAEARFHRLLTAILEQWEEGYFQPLKEKPMTPLQGARGCAFMEPIPWWYPKQDLDELPWSDRERLLIMGVPVEARFHWSREYRNDVSHRSMLEGSSSSSTSASAPTSTGNFVEDVAADLRENHRIREAATANDRTNFGYVADPAIDKALIDRLDHHRDFVNQLFENPEMLSFVRRWVGNDVYSAFEEDRQSGGVG